MPSEAVKLEREKRKTAREARLMQLMALNPGIMRLAELAILLYGTRMMRDHAGDNLGMRDISVALASIGAPLIAADAGIRDKYALAAIAGFAGLAVGEGKSGIVAWGSGAADTDALIRIDPSLPWNQGVIGQLFGLDK